MFNIKKIQYNQGLAMYCQYTEVGWIVSTSLYVGD